VTVTTGRCDFRTVSVLGESGAGKRNDWALATGRGGFGPAYGISQVNDHRGARTWRLGFQSV